MSAVVKTNKYVVIYAGALALFLLIPIFLMPGTDSSVREWWERRKLTEAPELSEFMVHPKAAFSQFDEFISDNLGGSFEIIQARRKFYYNVLGVTGDKYIVRDSSGAVFLTSTFMAEDRNTPFSWWRRLCEKFQMPDYQAAYVKRLKNSAGVLGRLGAKVVFTSVPTKAVLIPDRLPISTPEDLVENCRLISGDDNHIRTMQASNPGLNLFYPIQDFKERMNDPYFFPDVAYHWSGESSWVFVEAFAKQYGLRLPEVWPTGPCINQNVKWDIGRLMVISTETAGCDRSEEVLELVTDERFDYPLNAGAAKKSVRVAKLTNPHAENDLTAVMFSNSFGPIVRSKFAAQFRTTYHLNGNRINPENMQLLLGESEILDADYAVVIVADFHYPRFLARFE